MRLELRKCLDDMAVNDVEMYVDVMLLMLWIVLSLRCVVLEDRFIHHAYMIMVLKFIWKKIMRHVLELDLFEDIENKFYFTIKFVLLQPDAGRLFVKWMPGSKTHKKHKISWFLKKKKLFMVDMDENIESQN